MSEMVERIARVLCECEGHHPDHRVVMLSKPDGKGFEWEFYADKARHVLDAMREPTEAMRLAGSGPVLQRNAVVGTWRAMIDEALK